jgi:hypothetical protein
LDGVATSAMVMPFRLLAQQPRGTTVTLPRYAALVVKAAVLDGPFVRKVVGDVGEMSALKQPHEATFAP